MGVLMQQIDLESKKDYAQYYKNNTLEIYNLYQNPDNRIEFIDTSNIVDGRFYNFFYYDESNWMRYSPVLFIDSKRFEDRLIGYAINFNFIPLEIRSAMLDTYINDFVDNSQLSWLNFENAYKLLLKFGYEYALVEYDMKRVETVCEISFELLPKFLYSSYPSNKYDPQKLYSIWLKKLETRELRHQELIKSTIEDFYDMKTEITEKFEALENHVKRLQRNVKKFGGS